MEPIYISTGFILGLLGSLHCLGMCGPIALALPINQTSKASLLFSRFLYNFGRIISYSLMGFVFGLLGGKLKLVGLQQILSISTGVLILIYALFPQKSEAILISIPFIKKIFQKIQVFISPLFKEKSSFALLKIGVLNGFLPCGFVYVGITGAIATGSPLAGMLFMALFGLGTFPLMFAVSVFSSVINLKLRLKIRKVVPAFVVVIAILFILRGLSLGIPFLSPVISESSPQPMSECCD